MHALDKIFRCSGIFLSLGFGLAIRAAEPTAAAPTVAAPTAAAPIAAAPTAAAAPDPQLPYQAERSNPVTYDVDFSAVVMAPGKAEVLKVWLPMPPSNVAQEVTEGDLTTFPMDVKPTIATEPLFGNRFACFEFPSPQGGQIIRHRFKVKVWELHWNLDPSKILAVKEWPKSFDKYRRGESQAVVVDDRFERLLNQIVPQRTNPLRDMATVMRWVNKNFVYDHGDASLQASSVHAIEDYRGHCSDYHGFCAAMGRVMGYPTRVTYGINPFPKNSPSHCKLEVFLRPYGWVSFDVSETQNMLAAIQKDTELDQAQKAALSQAAQDRLVHGFRDNTWYMQTVGTDYDLAPAASKRVPVVRTIYAEVDGVPLPDGDPVTGKKREFAWLTVQKFTADKAVSYPFKDFSSLKAAAAGKSRDAGPK
ncbi:MAG TPA: transglutaminase-like domain-containing protein [Pirellulales bacterium]|jgi:transglutaminase-like putative cysteine protease|nr:transglutaminase-like domain-containing protein [Pirellulales bacterium]